MSLQGWSSAGTGGECIDSQTSQYSLTEIPASGTVAGCSIPSDDDRATLATLCQCIAQGSNQTSLLRGAWREVYQQFFVTFITLT